MIVCSLIHTLPALWLVVNNKATNTLKNSDRFMLGCKAAAGIPVSDISKETQISRTYIYQLKANVQNYMESLDKAENHVLSINIDKGFIERMVLSLPWTAMHLRKAFRGILHQSSGCIYLMERSVPSLRRHRSARNALMPGYHWKALLRVQTMRFFREISLY